MHISGKRIRKDAFARRVMLVLTCAISSLILLIALGLFLKSRFILSGVSPIELFLSDKWHPTEGHFGFMPFIIGTIWVTSVAMILAAPAALFSAIYLAEYAPGKLRDNVKPILDVLAGISPVIFGVFGVLIIVPWVKDYIKPFAQGYLGFIPFLRSDNFTGYSVIAAGIVLALMVFPVITQVSEEVIRSQPQELRDSSLALGATKWETIKYVVLRRARPGIIAAMILGLSRAFGETIAVLMVIGCVAHIPHSIFDAAYTLPALIANNYGEMMSIPLYDSALLLAALILLVVTVLFNIVAWLILLKVEREYV